MTIATTTLASMAEIKAQGTSDDTEQTDITAQSTSGDTEQVKEYLNQAIQAIDDGNNTLALEQVGLASDSLQTMTGGADAAAGGEEDDKGTTEEDAGEDTDESGDVDTDDEEDSQSK